MYYYFQCVLLLKLLHSQFSGCTAFYNLCFVTLNYLPFCSLHIFCSSVTLGYRTNSFFKVLELFGISFGFKIQMNWYAFWALVLSFLTSLGYLLNLIILFFQFSLDPCIEILTSFSHLLHSSLLIFWVISIASCDDELLLWYGWPTKGV